MSSESNQYKRSWDDDGASSASERKRPKSCSDSFDSDDDGVSSASERKRPKSCSDSSDADASECKRPKSCSDSCDSDADASDAASDAADHHSAAFESLACPDQDVAPMSQLCFGIHTLDAAYRNSIPPFYTPAMVVSTFLGENEEHPGQAEWIDMMNDSSSSGSDDGSDTEWVDDGSGSSSSDSCGSDDDESIESSDNESDEFVV
jgi:hypothetical protein